MAIGKGFKEALQKAIRGLENGRYGLGFSDKYLAGLLGIRVKDIRRRRNEPGIREGWHAVPVSGVGDACYYYSR